MNSNIDNFIEIDQNNFDESKRALQELNSSSLETAEELYDFLNFIATEFGKVCGYDAQQKKFNKAINSIPPAGDVKEFIKLLELSPIIGTINGEDPIGDGKKALENGYSIVVRTFLLLRLARDFLRGLTEILKLRITPAIGILRLQAESIALISLIKDNSEIAHSWINAISTGKSLLFFNKYHSRIVEKIKSFDLYDIYQRGSNMSQHSRIYGVGLGAIIGGKIAPPGTISLTFQEIDSQVFLLFWFYDFLRIHLNIIEKMPEITSEIDFTGDTTQNKLNNLREMIARLKETSTHLYLEKRKHGVKNLLLGDSDIPT